MPLIQTVDVSYPGELNIRAQRGAYFAVTLTFGTGVEDFTTESFRMAAKVEKTGVQFLSITEATDPATVGAITGGTNRSINVVVPSAATEDWPERLCDVQIEMAVGSDWVPVITGKLIVKPNPIPAGP